MRLLCWIAMRYVARHAQALGLTGKQKSQAEAICRKLVDFRGGKPEKSPD